MTLRRGASKEQRDVVHAINAVRYRTRTRVARLKAAEIDLLGTDDADSPAGYRRFLRGDRSDAACQAVIDLFTLGVWLDQTPRGTGAPFPGDWQAPCDRDTAVLRVGSLISASLETGSASVDYDLLQRWFFEDLFGADVRYFSFSLGPPTQVVALDNAVIAACWLG